MKANTVLELEQGIAACFAEVNNNTVKQEWENGLDDNRTISWEKNLA